MLPVLASKLWATDILAILILCPSVMNLETGDLTDSDVQSKSRPPRNRKSSAKNSLPTHTALNPRDGRAKSRLPRMLIHLGKEIILVFGLAGLPDGLECFRFPFELRRELAHESNLLRGEFI